MIKGYKTLLFNGLLFVLPAAAQYLLSVDWSQYVSPQTALMIVTAANMVLRMVTTGPVGTRIDGNR